MELNKKRITCDVVSPALSFGRERMRGVTTPSFAALIDMIRNAVPSHEPGDDDQLVALPGIVI